MPSFLFHRLVNAEAVKLGGSSTQGATAVLTADKGYPDSIPFSQPTPHTPLETFTEENKNVLQTSTKAKHFETHVSVNH